MNKTKKNGTFTLLKIVFPVRGYQKESLKQSMMIEKQCVFALNSLLLECILSVLIVADFLAFPYTSHNIPTSWSNIKSPLLLYRQT